MDDKVLEQVYQEKLEERIIARIAEEKAIPLEKAMNIYYSSDLADKIHQGGGSSSLIVRYWCSCWKKQKKISFRNSSKRI